MIRFISLQRQRGATLVVGLIMLVLVTLMVVTAFTLSSSNLKAVGNMQFRNEAIAAANKAIEQVVSSNFTTATAAETINVDMNSDGTNDYMVTVEKPDCVRATKAGKPPPSSTSMPGLATAANWNTVWNIRAIVTDATTGANVTTHAGVRVLRTQAQKEAECD